MARPLRRNRDFVLLQSGQLLSNLGSESTVIVYPLLVLALTGSASQAGLVTFARLLPFALFGLLAGVAADRYDRRAIMVATDAVRALATAGLVVTIALDSVAVWQLVVVGFVEGAGSAFFRPAASGALRSVVTTAQLPDAAGVQETRTAAVLIAGPPLGGALFGLGRAVPFVADIVSYAVSAISLLLMRTPFQDVRPATATPAKLRERLQEGFRFLWHEPFLRTTTFLFGLSNFIGPGVLLVVVVAGEREGLSSGRIGLLLGLLGAGIMVGSLASPMLRRRLSTRTILVFELWMWLAPAVFLVWPNVYVLAASVLLPAFAIPVTNAVVIGYRLAITPDHVLGRVESVRSTIALLIAPLGPLAAGLLMNATTARATVAVFVAASVVLALWGTLSPAIRNAPRLAA